MLRVSAPRRRGPPLPHPVGGEGIRTEMTDELVFVLGGDDLDLGDVHADGFAVCRADDRAHLEGPGGATSRRVGRRTRRRPCADANVVCCRPHAAAGACPRASAPCTGCPVRSRVANRGTRRSNRVTSAPDRGLVEAPCGAEDGIALGHQGRSEGRVGRARCLLACAAGGGGVAGRLGAVAPVRASMSRASMVLPATAAGMIATAPPGIRKQSWVATPKPRTRARLPENRAARSAGLSSRASKARPVSSRASSRPVSTTPEMARGTRRPPG